MNWEDTIGRHVMGLDTSHKELHSLIDRSDFERFNSGFECVLFVNRQHCPEIFAARRQPDHFPSVLSFTHRPDKWGFDGTGSDLFGH
jgi:hypothetical protein